MSSKDKSKATQATGTEKTKEIKIITRQVVSIGEVQKNPRLLRLLYVISLAGSLSEKALVTLLYEFKVKGYDLGYNFATIGGTVTSRDVLNDLTMLKYLGLVEVGPNRKLRIAGSGREFLDAKREELKNDEQTIKSLYEELKPKILPMDLEVEVKSRQKTR